MIVIHKKNIQFVIGLMCLMLGAVSILRATKNHQSITASSLPVTNKVIVIDARTRCSG